MGTPTQVGTEVWTEIAGGYDHCLATDGGGRLWSWGGNDQGQLGLGDNTDRNTPTMVPLPEGLAVLHFSAGLNHSAAILDDQTLWTWGNNTYGQLGEGTTASSNTPVQIPGTWSLVHCGSNRTLAIKDLP